MEKARKGKNAKGRVSHAANGQPHAADRGSREEHPGKAKKTRKGKKRKRTGVPCGRHRQSGIFLTYRPPMATLGEHIRQSTAYKWWILGMIMLGTFMAVLDVTVVNVGLPAIMSAFGIGISSAEWVITAYMITMTIMLPSAYRCGCTTARCCRARRLPSPRSRVRPARTVPVVMIAARGVTSKCSYLSA